MIIGIGGVSRSGKTVLAKKMPDLFSDQTTEIFSQDLYTFDDLPLIRDHINWEIPESVDFSRLVSEVQKSAADIIIVEGILVFANEELNKLYNRRIVFNITEDIFKERKRIDLRWGMEPEWYIEHIWNSYLLHGQPTDERILEIDGERPYSLDKVRKYIISDTI